MTVKELTHAQAYGDYFAAASFRGMGEFLRKHFLKTAHPMR